jgi:hypothetical protein
MVVAFPLAHAAEYLQLSESTLISRPGLKFTLDQKASAAGQVATLIHQPALGAPIEVATSK